MKDKQRLDELIQLKDSDITKLKENISQFEEKVTKLEKNEKEIIKKCEEKYIL